MLGFSLPNGKYLTEALVIWAEDKEGDWAFSLYEMVFKGDDIKIKNHIGEVEAKILDETLQSYLHLPILLHIVGDSIFEKAIQGKRPSVSDVLGLRVENVQDFMLQVFEEKNHSYYGCVIRKASLTDLLSYLPSHTNRVVSMYLGRFLPSAFLASFIPHFSQRTFLIERKGQVVGFENGEISTQTPGIGTEKIGLRNYFQGENIDETKLEMYAHMLLLRISPAVCTLGDFATKYADFLSRKYKTQIFQIVSGIFMFILVFLLIQFWSLKYQSYQQGEQYAAEQPQLEKLTQNIEKIKGYQQLTQQFTSLNQSYASWMLDKFAHLKPQEVHFTRCVLHATEEEWKSKEGTLPKQADFLIEGVTPHSLEISTFVSRLEQLSFIKNVEVWESQFDFQTEQHRFSLAINCK